MHIYVCWIQGGGLGHQVRFHSIPYQKCVRASVIIFVCTSLSFRADLCVPVKGSSGFPWRDHQVCLHLWWSGGEGSTRTAAVLTHFTPCQFFICRDLTSHGVYIVLFLRWKGISLHQLPIQIQSYKTYVILSLSVVANWTNSPNLLLMRNDTLNSPYWKAVFCENQSSALLTALSVSLKKPGPYVNWSTTPFQYVQCRNDMHECLDCFLFRLLLLFCSVIARSEACLE